VPAERNVHRYKGSLTQLHGADDDAPQLHSTATTVALAVPCVTALH
jgi:hypothetical protein